MKTTDKNTVPSALLHDGANKLSNQCEELLCVSGMELLQEGEKTKY